VIVGAVHGTDAEHGVPVFRGERAHRALLALFGLPNAAPSVEERARLGALAYFSTRRALFVDDLDDGHPRAVWLPDAARAERSGR
jgi:hypothetical protein